MIKAEIDINNSVIGSIEREIVSAVELKNNNPNESEMLVHEFRKTIKRIRAILRLIKHSLSRKTYFNLDSELSQIAKSIAEAREAAANLRSLLHLDSLSQEKLPIEIRDRAVAELSKQYKLAYHDTEGGIGTKLDNVLFKLHIFLNKLENNALSQSTSDQLFISLSKSYYKSARLYNDAYSSLEKEVIHKWRKYNKNLLLQLFYFPIDIVKEEQIIEQLHSLTDLLGTDHDYAELEDNLSRHINFKKDEVLIIHRIIDNLRLRIQKNAFEIGKKLYSQPIKIYRSANN